MSAVDRVSFRLVAFCLTGICATGAARGAELSGHVRDENEAPVASARVTVRAVGPATGLWQAQTGPAGAFLITVPAAGDYRIDVECEGYYELRDRPIHVEGAQELTLVINRVREVFQSIDVDEKPSPVDIAQTRQEEHLSGTEVNNIPYSSSHSLRSSMKLMPGVVQDQAGQMHFNGSSENQVQYLLNGFDIADPISGQFITTLAVEGIRSLNYTSGRYSPEHGKGSAGVLAVNTENGSDAFHFTATDFIPGIRVQQGVALGNWYPRVGVSGPIVRGRAWFSDTFDSQYNNSLITGLPAGQNTRTGWAGSNLLHGQGNLSARNIVFADFLVNADHEGRVGLSPLDPVSTTQSIHARQIFASVKDQVSFGGGSLLEFGYARNEFSTKQTPQGQNPYVFSPLGRSGNYFVASTQTASRDQGLVHAFAPRIQLAGWHQLEGGADADLLRYAGDFRRTGYELVGLSGQLLSRTSFFGPGVFHVHDREVSGWVLDTWRITERLQVDAGLREDWDHLVGSAGWSPRIAFSWAPFRAGHTRVAGGYSVTRDAVPLDPFGRILDQTAATTQYDSAGLPSGEPAPTSFAAGSRALRLPRATNWSLGVDHEVSARLYASLKYLRRRGTDGFDFLNTLAPDAPPSLLPLPNGASAGAYQLANLRRDNYDSIQLAVRQTLSGQHEWMASYTRSRTLTNAVLDPNSAETLQVLPALVPMPWDSPDRFLAWTYLPLPWKKWSVAALADARSGFPFSIQDQTGVVKGGVNSHRYPFHFDLNLSIERMIVLRGYRFALRGGVDNLTDHRNSTAVNNVIGSPQYLQFLGDEGRHFVARIRFFGRAGGK